MKENEIPFIGIMSLLSPGQTIVVPSAVENSFILNLDWTASWDSEPNRLAAGALRQIAQTLSSIAESLEEVTSAWDAIDDDEEDEDIRLKMVDTFELIHSDANANILALIAKLKDDVEDEFN